MRKTVPPDRDPMVPEGWVATTLGKVTSPSRERVEPEGLRDVPYLSLEHIESNTTRVVGHGKSADVRSTKSVFRAGDVLYGKLRPYLNKVAVPDFGGVCSTDILVFPKSPYVDSKFLMWFLMQPAIVAFANQNSSGIQLPRTSFSKLAELEFSLPPYAEQRRIVANLEQLFGKVDACRKRLANIPAVLKRFRQSVLSAACSGRLTAEWRGQNYGDTAGETSDDVPFGWKSVSVGDVIESLKYGTAQKCDSEKRGVPVLRIPNVVNGTIDHTDLKYARLTPRELEQLRLISGDILLIRSNGSVSLVGRTALVRDAEKGFAYAGYLIRLRPKRTVVMPAFLNLVFGTFNIRLQIELEARSTSGVHNINGEEVRALTFALPPLDEQREIVRRVEALFLLADRMGARLGKAQSQIDQLTPCLLTKAFCGELVPTEAELAKRERREYERASALIERIEREHAKLESRTASAGPVLHPRRSAP